MPESISIHELSLVKTGIKLIDVRKEPARFASGLHIDGSHYRKPFDADNWWQEFHIHTVVVYCVHGQEVSQAVCGFLNDNGVDVRYLEGGFEAWREAGFPTCETGMESG